MTGWPGLSLWLTDVGASPVRVVLVVVPVGVLCLVVMSWVDGPRRGGRQ